MKVKFNLVPSYNFKKNKYLNNSIYFMHVPKSGGTTIDHIFAKLSHILKNFDFHRIKYNKNNVDIPEIKPQYVLENKAIAKPIALPKKRTILEFVT